jgi:hypothetical protein
LALYLRQSRASWILSFGAVPLFLPHITQIVDKHRSNL